MYPYGSIVIVAQFLDPQGRNPKDRPCIVVTPEAENLGADDLIRVIAISCIVPDPLPADHVPLEWQKPFHPSTKLDRRSVAICGWIVTVENSRIIKPHGRVPTRTMLRIARVLQSLIGPASARETDPAPGDPAPPA